MKYRSLFFAALSLIAICPSPIASEFQPILFAQWTPRAPMPIRAGDRFYAPDVGLVKVVEDDEVEPFTWLLLMKTR